MTRKVALALAILLALTALGISGRVLALEYEIATQFIKWAISS
jgi:hypothetical protein